MLKCKINGLKIWVRLKLKKNTRITKALFIWWSKTVGPVKHRGSGAWQCWQIDLVRAVWQRRRSEGWKMNNVISVFKESWNILFLKIRFSRWWNCTCREEFFLLTNLLLACHLCILSPFLKFFCQNLLNVQEFNVLSIGIILNIFTYNICNTIQYMELTCVFCCNIYCTPINHLKPLSRGMNIYLMFLVVCPKTGTWVTGYWWRSSHTYTHPRTLRPLLVSVYHRSHARRPVRCYEILKNAYASI